MDIITDFGSVVLGSSPGGCTYEKGGLWAAFLVCAPTAKPGRLCVRTRSPIELD